MAEKKKWIQGMNLKKGALSQQAADAKMSIPEFCAQSGLDSTTQKRCVLAKTFSKMRKK
jgi:hypothetical protein